MPVTRAIAQSTSQALRRQAKAPVARAAQAAAQGAGDRLVRQAAPALRAAAPKALAPAALTQKAQKLMAKAGLSEGVARAALGQADEVFQRALAGGAKQKDALALAKAALGQSLQALSPDEALIQALGNGLMPSTRSKAAAALAQGQVASALPGGAERLRVLPGQALPQAPRALAPAPGPKALLAPAPAPRALLAPGSAAKPPSPRPVAPAAVAPAAVAPAAVATGAAQAAAPLPKAQGLRDFLQGVEGLARGTHEAGRQTRRAADATYDAGRALRATMDGWADRAQGPVGQAYAQAWNQGWARHQRAHDAAARGLLEGGQGLVSGIKALLGR